MGSPFFRSFRATLGLVGAGLLLGTNPATAHHSFALFDVNKSVALEGTVKQFDWTNPHSWIRLTVLGANSTRGVAGRTAGRGFPHP